MHGRRRCLSLSIVLSILIAGCGAPARLQQVVAFDRPESGLSVLLMPADVQFEQRGLIGSKARVDWAAEARQKIETIVRDILESKNVSVGVFLATDSRASEAQEAALTQQRLLFQQLAERLVYGGRAGYIIGARRLSFASVLHDLRQASDARYALFLALHDRYSSAERVVGQVALGALFVASVVFLGVPLTPLDLDDASPRYASYRAAPAINATRSGSGCPEQTGYASLIDLDTGDLVWLNRVFGGCSDLRDPDDLRNTLELLLSGLA
ncbi:MAG: hypothetical protein ACXW6V_24065 [Candidatus Binatia bacterium]